MDQNKQEGAWGSGPVLIVSASVTMGQLLSDF